MATCVKYFKRERFQAQESKYCRNNNQALDTQHKSRTWCEIGPRYATGYHVAAPLSSSGRLLPRHKLTNSSATETTNSLVWRYQNAESTTKLQQNALKVGHGLQRNKHLSKMPLIPSL